MSLVLYPALDIRDGRVVRLKQGDYARETRYDTDPLAQAVRYARAGAHWLHLVDLDAARAGGYTLHALLGAIKRDTGLRVQTGGGVRRETDLLGLIEAGADRVVLGSLAVREPERVAGWIARYGAERITVALDTRRDSTGQWRLPVHGWTEDEADGPTLDRLAVAYAGIGLKHLLCTDIGRDGMLAGPNLPLYARLRTLAPSLAVQASGGVRDLADIHAAQTSGCVGVVLGKALLDGRFDFADALREAEAC